MHKIPIGGLSVLLLSTLMLSPPALARSHHATRSPQPQSSTSSQPSAPGYAGPAGTEHFAECRRQVNEQWPWPSGGYVSMDFNKDHMFAACVANGGTLH